MLPLTERLSEFPVGEHLQLSVVEKLVGDVEDVRVGPARETGAVRRQHLLPALWDAGEGTDGGGGGAPVVLEQLGDEAAVELSALLRLLVQRIVLHQPLQ